MAKKHDKSVLVSERLVPLPVNIDPDAHVPGELRRGGLSARAVIGLHESACGVRFQARHETLEKIGRENFVGIHHGE